MRTISEILTELTAAESLVRALRDERTAALIEACGKHPGNVFEKGGQRYRVRSISASSRSQEVWLICDWWTSAKRWSQGAKAVAYKVEV